MSEKLLFTSDSKRYPGLPLALDGMGLFHLQEPVVRANGVPFYQWVQSVKGTGRLILNQQSFLIPEGCGVYLPMDIPHEYYAVTDLWVTNFLCFSGSCAAGLLSSLGFGNPGVYSLQEPEKILASEQEIYDIYQSSLPDKALETSKILYQLILDLSVNITKSSTSAGSISNQKILNAARFMELHFKEQISLYDIAESVQLSREYLCTLFKKSTGTSVSDYLLNIRMVHAKTYLIQYPDKKIKEVAAMSGFSDSSYFCSVFKKTEQMTPNEFRELRH